MLLSADCLTLFCSSPNNSKAWMQRSNEKATHWNNSDTNLTSQLCATSKASLFLANDWRLPFLSYVNSQLWRLYFDLLASFSFVWLCLCLSLFHQTALQHSEPLALCALRLIFMWSMKADGMPSSQTPCEEPVESCLNICSVGKLDLTPSDIIGQKMQIFDTLPLASLHLSVFYSSSLLFSFKRTLQQAATNMVWRANIYPCRIQLRFSFLSHYHSSKTLKLLLSFFITMSQYHTSELMFISHHAQHDCARSRMGGQI